MAVTGLCVMVATLAFLLVVGGCSRRSAPAPTTVPDSDGDALVIEELRASGADLSRPIPVDLFLYFPSEVAARTVASTMHAEGYSVEVRAPSPDIPSWACVATKPLLLTPAGIHDVRERWGALAESLGGEYDGWEAPVAHPRSD